MAVKYQCDNCEKHFDDIDININCITLSINVFDNNKKMEKLFDGHICNECILNKNMDFIFNNYRKKMKE